MAFAIASGVPPQAGLYCGIVTGFVISALGGSKTQIGGPTGAFVVVVAGIIAQHGLEGLFMCTMMAGALLILLGVTGMGTAVKSRATRARFLRGVTLFAPRARKLVVLPLPNSYCVHSLFAVL